MEENERTLAWAVGGQSGEGIDSTGEIFARALHRHGYFVFASRSFPSRIKGGQACYTVRIGTRPVRCESAAIHFLVAFDRESVDENLARVAPDGLVVHDDSFQVRAAGNGPRTVGVPLRALAAQAGSPIMKNMVALGVSASLLGLPREALKAALHSRFGKKGGRVLAQNQAALEKGFEAARSLGREPAELFSHHLPPSADPSGARRRLFISGNEAVVLGALAAGCRFFSGYPITPATEIMTGLIRLMPRFGGAVIQTEDEIAAITMAIGAGYAGVRAMTATSGPGLSLMTEALSLAGMTETPVVIVDVQRGGPSTGLPTKTEQGNLNELIFGGHGEFPRIVLAPATPEDCCYLTAEAFNLAEAFQCPVLVASDLTLGLSKQTIDGLDPGRIGIERGALFDPAVGRNGDGAAEFRRYRFTADGVSPRALPGQPGGRHLVTGDEHDEAGRITEDPRIRARMVRKRLDKIARLDLSAVGLHYEGPPDPEVLLTGWGGTYGAIAEARAILERRGWQAAVLQVKALHTFPAAAVTTYLKRAGRVLVVENNATGQLAGLIRREAGFGEKLAGCLKFNGVPFRPEEIVARAEEVSADIVRPALHRPMPPERCREVLH